MRHLAHELGRIAEDLSDEEVIQENRKKVLDDLTRRRERLPDPRPLDLSKYPSPQKAAKALYDWLKRFGKKEGFPTKYLKLQAPTAEEGRGSHWRILWEDGPHQWGTILSLRGKVEDYVIKHENPHWFLLPYYAFDIQFVKLDPSDEA